MYVFENVRGNSILESLLDLFHIGDRIVRKILKVEKSINWNKGNYIRGKEIERSLIWLNDKQSQDEQ